MMNKNKHNHSQGQLSGWPSGLRRQTQALASLLCIGECSGPRMRAWVRIPLLTHFLEIILNFLNKQE